MKRTVPILLLFLLFLLPTVVAEGPLDQLITTFQGLTTSLGITEPAFVSFVRLALIILVAFLLYELFHLFMSKAGATMVGIVLGIISVIFIPSQVLIGIIATYTLVASVILLLVPIGLLLFLVYGVLPGSSVPWRILRLVVILIALIIEGGMMGWLT